MFIKFFYLLVIKISVAIISTSDYIIKIIHILKNISHFILHCKKLTVNLLKVLSGLFILSCKYILFLFVCYGLYVEYLNTGLYIHCVVPNW